MKFKVPGMSWPCSSDLDFFCQHSFTPGIPAIANNLQLPKPCAHFTPPHLGICRFLRLECSYRLPEHACKPPASPTPLLRDTAPASPLLSSFINHPLPTPQPPRSSQDENTFMLCKRRCWVVWPGDSVTLHGRDQPLVMGVCHKPQVGRSRNRN